MTNDMPPGWTETTLGEIIELRYGKSLPAKNRDAEGDIAVYGSSGVVGRHSVSLVGGPCIVVGRKGNVGSVFLSKSDCWPIDTTYFVSSQQDIDVEFLYRLLDFLRLGKLDKSTAIPGLSRDDVYKLMVGLPPLSEQRRIVEKIETLFAELDKGEESLRQVQALLARYRQSVLKAAVTGQLTADWRAKNAHRLEHGRDLLARILKARRESWEGRGKYKEPVEPDTTNLPELPEGWVWASVEQLSSSLPNSLCIGPFGSNLKVDDYRVSGVPLVFVRNVRSRNFDGLDPKFVSEEKAMELASHSVYPGDLLITKMGDPPGDVCIYPEGRPRAIITADCIRFAPSKEGLCVGYLEKAIASNVVQAQIRSISKGVAQQKVTLANFKRIAIPVPPYVEQKVIAGLVEEELVRVGNVEKVCQIEAARSAALRQSILKDAFSGKLVPQDPNDEPAAELLARIKAARAGKSKQSRRSEVPA